MTTATTIKLRGAAIGKPRVVGDVVRDVSVATAGEAIGHNFFLDGESLRQIAALINAKSRVKVHISHPPDEGIDKIVGYVARARVVGTQVKADLVLLPSSPHYQYVTDLIETLPQSFGLSITFVGPIENHGDRRVARIEELESVDLVGQPGANPRGLLSKKEMAMNEEQMATMRELLGLAEDATIEEILSAIKALTDTGTEDEEADPAALAAAGVQSERLRAKQIRCLATSLHLPDQWAQSQIDKGNSMATAKKLAMQEVATMHTTNNVRGANFNVGEDRHLVSLGAAMTDAICLRTGTKLAKPHERAKHFGGMRLHELARTCLASAGFDTVGKSPTQLLSDAFSPRNRIQLAQSSSDFSAILGDSFAKSLRLGYTEQAPSWQTWAREAPPVRDFRPVHRVGVGAFPTPTERDEGDGITYVNISDDEVVYSMREFAQGVKLTWRSIVNDDLQVFADNLRKMAIAARRVEDDLAFAAFTSNPTMPDGETLFSASHASGSNLVSSSSGPPSVSNVGALNVLLAMQKSGSATLNLQPKYLLVPVSLQITTTQLVASLADGEADHAGVMNPFQGKLEVVANARLDTAPAAWYLFASPTEIDTVEVGFLEGRREPELKQESDFDTDDVKFAVKHTVVAAALDHRGLVKTVGTA